MGRPSRKRPHPPPFTEAENSSRQHTAAPFLTGAHCAYSGNSSLRSLLLVNSSSSSSSGSSGTSRGKDDHADEATLTAQHVWGALSESDIAAASPALSVGVNIEIDRAGVAWLVNTSTREQRQRRWERSSAAGSLGSEDRRISPSPPHKHPISGKHDASASASSAEEAANLVAPVSGQHDDAKHSALPCSGEPFCACEASLRERLSRAKEEFDEVPAAVFKRVRSACNPAEALGSGPFLNRSAMKLANIDAVVEGSLSRAPGRARKEDGEREQKKAPASGEVAEADRPPLLFGDLCGGPGGFSEYLLRRRRQLGLPARGWGISLGEGGDGDEGSRAGRGIGVIDSIPRESCGGGSTSRDAAVMDDKLTGASSGGDCCTRNSAFVLGGEDHGTMLSREGTERSTGGPTPVAHCAAGRSPGTAAAGERQNARSWRRDDVGRNTDQDPCAWRLDHLRPWCDLSVPAAGTEATPAATTGDIATNKHAAGDGAAVDAAVAAAAAAASAASLLEMQIDYGPKGTGDLTDEANLRGFVDKVLASTAGRRLDLVVADGGFGAARDAPEQESLLSPLVHCEALAALLLVGEGGAFVCKLFECWTESTAALLYLLHCRFGRIAIIKPITSRPASGERYLVCTGLLPPPPSPLGCRLTEALRAKVQAMPEPDDAATDGVLCDALGVEAEMKQDESFVSYLRLSNNTLASLQAEACTRIVGVASTKRGRAWAFRDSNSNRRGVRGGSGGSGGGKSAVATRGGILSGAEGAEESGDEAAAVRCLSTAWGLDGI